MRVTRAFVLGAGLGTRLRPLTEALPKPMVPVFGRPLISLTFDHLAAAGIGEFVVNTHHCPEAYQAHFGGPGRQASHSGRPLVFRHEAVLLDTGGGIKNVEDLLGGEPFILHNADILADLDLRGLIHAHFEKENDVTLGLLSGGGPLQVSWDPDGGSVLDIRGALGSGIEPRYLYTGIAVISPSIFQWLGAGVVESVVPAWLRMIRAGRRVGGVLLDGGLWRDLGTPAVYAEAHRLIETLGLSCIKDPEWPRRVDPTAEIGAGSRLSGFCVVGAGARVGEGAEIHDCILWPGAETASRIRLRGCIVRSLAAESAANRIF